MRTNKRHPIRYRVLGLAAVTTLTLALTSCGEENAPVADEPTSEKSETTETTETPTPSEPAVEPVQGIIVKFEKGSSPGADKAARKDFFRPALDAEGLVPVKVSLSMTDTWVVALDQEISGDQLQSLLDQLGGLDGVEYAEPDLHMHAS